MAFQRTTKIDARRFTGGVDEAVELMQWLWKEYDINAKHNQIKETYLVFGNPSDTIKHESLRLNKNSKVVVVEPHHWIVIEGDDFFSKTDPQFRAEYQEIPE